MNNPPSPDNIGPLPQVPVALPDNTSNRDRDLLDPLPGLPSRAADRPRFSTGETSQGNPPTNNIAERGPLIRTADGTPRQPDARMPVEGRLHTPVVTPSATLDAIEARINQRAAERAAAQAAEAAGTPAARPANTAELGAPLPPVPGGSASPEQRPATATGGANAAEATPANQATASGAEAQPTPESQETEKTRLQKLKGVISAFTRPYTWTGKSRGAYIAGVLVGGTATGLGFAGMGPGLRWGITGATYAASFALEKISRWHLKKQLTPDERLRFEERYKNARYKLSGFSSGLAASSLMSLGLHLAAPDTMHAIADAAKDIGSASARAGGRLAIKGAIGAMNAAGDVAEFAGNAQDAVIGGIEQFGDNAVNVLDQVGTGSGGGLFERAGDIASELMDHAPGGESSLTSPGAIAAWREFLQEQGENASTTWAELWNHVAASGAENSAEALAAAQEFAAQTGGEAGSVLGDFIEKYFNVNEVVVQQGQPLEHILNNLEVTGHAYNSTEWMTEFVGRNYEALKVGNEIGLNNFDKFVLANPDAPAEEVRKQFFRAVHWIYPGQKLEIPLP